MKRTESGNFKVTVVVLGRAMACGVDEQGWPRGKIGSFVSPVADGEW